MSFSDEKMTSFWCDDCKAHIPASTRKLRARKRQHQAVHDRFAKKREKAEKLFAFEHIVAEAEHNELEQLRAQQAALIDEFFSDGRISAIAIYTDERAPEGAEWEPTGSLVFGKPILRQKVSA